MSASHFKIDKVQGALSRTLDFICLVSAFASITSIASLLSRSDLFIWPKPTSSDIAGWPAQYVVLLLSSLIAWNIVSGHFGMRKAYQPDSTGGQIAELVRTGGLWVAAIGLAIFLFKLREVSRFFVLSYILLSTFLIALRDWTETIVARRIYRRRGMRRTAVVIGNGGQANWLRQFLLDNYCPEPFALVRRVDPAEPDLFNGKDNPGANGNQSLHRDLTEVFVTVADLGADVSGLFPRLFERGIEAHIVPGVFDASIFKLALSSIGGVPLITLRPGTMTGLAAVLKRLFDFVVALLLLIAAAPVVAIIALLVKRSSPGPVCFKQERVGKGGRRFHIYKFRTMYQDADQILKSDAKLYKTYVENNYKLPKGQDPRVTFIGRILRELSLDELPQLVNVIRGDMSLVGPRPVVPAEIEQYGDYAPLLLSVQPGLTGQWQVSGRSDIADYARRVRLDMEYIRDQSMTKDLQILFRTVPVVLSREGAH